MKTSVRIFKVLLLTLLFTTALSSCDVQISDNGVGVSFMSSDLESREWYCETDYDGYSLARTLYFNPQGTGYYKEVIDYYDDYGNVASEHTNIYDLTWSVDLDGDMDIYLSDNSHITFDGISFINNDEMYGWFDGEKLYFQD